MSDNVWYCGVAPFRIGLGSPSGATSFSCAMPYEKIKECWWRVKLWQVITDVESTTSGVTTTLPSGTIPDDNFPLFQSELDLARQINKQKDYKQILGTSSIRFSIGGGAGGGPGILNASGTYYPYFNLSGDAGISITTDSTGSPTDSFTGTFNGSNVPIYIFDPGVDSYTATQLDITPVEWWPYASRADGSPIWNTTTGAQLQDPTN